MTDGARSSDRFSFEALLPLEQLRETARCLPVDQFLGRFPDPVLVLGGLTRPGQPDAWYVKTVDDRPATTGDPDETSYIPAVRPGDAPAEPAGETARDQREPDVPARVALVKKGAATLFPDMITIGRAPSNDIVLGYPTISKLHAYLKRVGDAWWLFDQRSTNGTFVDGARVSPGGSRRLADGALVGLGPSLRLTFLLPATLHARLQDGRGG